MQSGGDWAAYFNVGQGINDGRYAPVCVPGDCSNFFVGDQVRAVAASKMFGMYYQKWEVGEFLGTAAPAKWCSQLQGDVGEFLGVQPECAMRARVRFEIHGEQT